MIDDFLVELDKMQRGNPEVASRIKNYPMLVNGLEELDKMVGMKAFKADVIAMIKNVVTCQSIDNNRNHSVISGPPGCGKTSLAKILAKIYVALGLINRKARSSTTTYVTEKVSNIHPEIFIIIIMMVYTLLMNFSWFLLIGFAVLFLIILFFSPSSSKPSGKQINTPTERSSDDDFYIVLRREDLVSRYMGGSAYQAKEALAKCVGKVVFIDEAYSLIAEHNSFDSYGGEVLTALIEWMDDNRGNCLVIFGGYEDKIRKTIFRAQPGLERRCSRVYHIEEYTYEELFDIFNLQLKRKGLKLSRLATEINDCKGFFFTYKDYFPFSGGDAERLADFVEQFYSCKVFDSQVSGLSAPDFVSSDLLLQGLEQLKSVQRKKEKSPVNSRNALLESLFNEV